MVLIRRSITVNVGIVGPGAAWETRYRPALRKLAQRIRVSAVFDPVTARAEQVARECDAEVVHGLVTLINRPNVDAILFLDASWHGMEALRLLCAGNKPIYIAAEVGNDVTALQACHWTAMSYGLTLMPEFGWRYTPATGRLQELMATHLGRARTVHVDASFEKLHASGQSDGGEAERRFLLNLFDWSRYLIRTPPIQIESLGPSATSNGEVRTVRVAFQTPLAGGEAPMAEFRFHRSGSPCLANSPTGLRHEIECESGKAVIESADRISWQTETEPVTENLTSDRDEVEVMLDHFCRRVVGGLIPVTDLDDVCKGINLLDAVAESDRTGKSVALNGLSQ